MHGKMKILAFVDVHGDMHKVKEIAETAKQEQVSALVCAGDLSFFGSNLDLLIEKLDVGVPLIIIPGNHEVPADIKNVAKKFRFVKDIHVSAFELDSCIFIGLGGSKITPFSTPFELDEKEIKEKLNKFGKRKVQKSVLVIHEPPVDTTLDYISGIHLGSNAIRKFIEKHQPDYCICGHFHENAGKEDRIGRTTILNPGTRGQIIEI